jgi:hypothetical protein
MTAERETEVQKKATVARQWHGKHVPAAMNKHTPEELLEALFSIRLHQGYITRTPQESVLTEDFYV